jgi:hypothetical protein
MKTPGVTYTSQNTRKMPADKPEIGEIWFNGALGRRALIAKVTDDLVFFASLTGTRVSMSRRSAELAWKLERAVPENIQACSSQGCSLPAFICYERPLKEQEVVCPFHIPRGVQSRLLDQTETFKRDFFESERCDRCGEDGTEVFGELPPADFKHTTMWNCQFCNTWWVRGKISEYDTKSMTRLAWGSDVLNDTILKYHALPGYQNTKVYSWFDPANRFLHFNIHLKPGRNHQLKGPQALTLYDFVKMDDF